MTKLSDTAMVLAAGLGTRMRPLTLTKPKPLQVVGGKTMLDHALDRLVEAGMPRAVVNTHYLADQIHDHLKSRRDIEIIISYEPDLLDTGGGIKNALHHFGDKPFFALNADLPWLDAVPPSLQRMADAWDATRMDVLLLVMATKRARGFSADGDFMMKPDGRLWRKDALKPRPFVMISAQIIKPDLLVGIDEKSFSNSKIWNEAEVQQKLYGIDHAGSCYHVGTPQDLEHANALLASGQGWG